MLRIAILLFLMFRASAQDIRPSEVLDLTKRAARAPAPGGVGHGWGGGVPPMASHQAPPPELPLRVRIVQREPGRNQFSLNETLTCDVELANLGDKPVTIPWSSDEGLRPETWEEAEAVGYRDALVAFRLLDETGRDHFVGSETVHSLGSLPTTLRTIRPKEAVAIRASFRLSLQGGSYRAIFQGLPRGTAADVRLAARFYLYPYDYSSGRSENSIPIKLTAPRQPSR